MYSKIKEIVSNFDGVIGVIIKYKTGEKILINESKIFPSASLIKLFIAFIIEKDFYENKIKVKSEYKVGGCGILKNLISDIELSIKDLITLMICFSDNTATNILIDYMGMKNINLKIREAGFKNTILGRKMMDNLAKENGRDNFTTPEDVEKVLNYFYKNKDILENLKNQGYNNKINLYFARDERVKFAHKTGELKNIEHDAGRLFYNNDWVDIIVMTKELKNNSDGIKINNLIGKEVFNNII